MKTNTFTTHLSRVLSLIVFAVTLTGSGAAQQRLQITTPSRSGATTIEPTRTAGEYRGGRDLSASHVSYNDDSSNRTFGSAGASKIGYRYDALATNIKTKQVYTLGTSGGVVRNGGGIVTRLVPLDPETGSAVRGDIQLSLPLSITSGTSPVGIFSGWDRIVLLDGSTLLAYNIDLPSGAVTPLGFLALYSDQRALDDRGESWATWGTAEYSGGTIKLLYSASPYFAKFFGVLPGSVKRYDVSSGTEIAVADSPAAIYANAPFIDLPPLEASITGQVHDELGRGISGVLVRATGPRSTVTTAVTNTFGQYSLPYLAAGVTYVVSVEARRHRFRISSTVVELNSDLAGLDFEGIY